MELQEVEREGDIKVLDILGLDANGEGAKEHRLTKVSVCIGVG